MHALVALIVLLMLGEILASLPALRRPQWIAPWSPSDNWRTTEWH